AARRAVTCSPPWAPAWLPPCGSVSDRESPPSWTVTVIAPVSVAGLGMDTVLLGRLPVKVKTTPGGGGPAAAAWIIPMPTVGGVMVMWTWRGPGSRSMVVALLRSTGADHDPAGELKLSTACRGCVPPVGYCTWRPSTWLPASDHSVWPVI